MTAISIVIVSYNSRNDLPRCLTSILGTAADAEVILVDNASQDGSADFVESNFPTVRLLRQTQNLGFSAANNLGASIARGEILVFLNPDTITTPGWLENLCQVVAASATPCLVSPKILFIDHTPPTIYTCGNHVSFSGLTFCRGWGQSADNFQDCETVPAISGTCFAIAREVFQRLNGFDELFFLYLEDTDLSWRSRLAGCECKVAPGSQIYHQYELRFSPRKSYFLERNRYILLLKNLAAPTLIALLPLLLVSELIVWGYLIYQGPQYMWGKIKGYFWLIRHWRRILLLRQQAQRIRSVPDHVVLRAYSPRLSFAQTAPAPISALLEALTGPLLELFGRLPLLFTNKES